MIIPHHGCWPEIHETTFIAPSSDLIGEVKIGAHSSVWFQCVVRGDVNWVQIGNRTNIQDHSVLHVTRKASPLTVGDDVTVGHRVTLHGCTIGHRVLLGIGVIVLDAAVVGDDCLIGAGALITKKMVIPPRSLVYGAPAKVIRPLSHEEILFLKRSADHYVNDARGYIESVRGPSRLGTDSSDLDLDQSNESEDLLL